MQARSTFLQDQGFAPAGSHSATSVQSQSFNLTAGYHSIEVDYCNLYSAAELSLKWKGPTDSAYAVSTLYTVLATGQCFTVECSTVHSPFMLMLR